MKKEKKGLPNNFKNYLAYIKKRTIQNKTLGKCNICNKENKLENNVCYACYKKQYNGNIDYTKKMNSTEKIITTTIATNTNKRRLALIGLGALVPIIGVSTYFIIRYTKDNKPSTSTLAQLKEKEKEKIRNIKPSEKILQGASLSPITTKNKYENVIDSAIKKIDNSKTKDELNTIVAEHKKLVTSARDIYANAIKFANKKHLANNEIKGINIPTLNAAAHSAAKYTLIIDAKNTAKQEISSTKTSESIALKLEVQKNLIKKAIEDYNASTGTLAVEKAKANNEINVIDIPSLNKLKHSFKKYELINLAKQNALNEINSAKTSESLASKLEVQKNLIKKAIEDYNKSEFELPDLNIGNHTLHPWIEKFNKRLNEINNEIKGINIPTLDAAAHSARIHALINVAKQKALQEINAFTDTDIKKLNEFKKAKIIIINKAIENYNKSKGTDIFII